MLIMTDSTDLFPNARHECLADFFFFFHHFNKELINGSCEYTEELRRRIRVFLQVWMVMKSCGKSAHGVGKEEQSGDI